VTPTREQNNMSGASNSIQGTRSLTHFAFQMRIWSNGGAWVRRS
jgi:hypothetical protein